MHEADLSKQFLDVIPHVMRRVRAEMREAAREDLTVPQFRILALVRGGTSTNAEIAELLGVSEPGTCRMVGTLVERGFLRQKRDEIDRRIVRLELTPMGQARFDHIKGTAQARFEEQFASLSPARRAALRKGLEALDEAFR